MIGSSGDGGKESILLGQDSAMEIIRHQQTSTTFPTPGEARN